jgi:hypothetical protein
MMPAAMFIDLSPRKNKDGRMVGNCCGYWKYFEIVFRAGAAKDRR